MVELIIALDVTDAEKAVEMAKEVSEFVSAVKVNYPLVLSAGIGIVERLKDVRPVIADFKIADIPYTSSLIAEIAFTHGVEAVIVHGFSGRETVKAVLNVAEEFGGEVYVVTELTSSCEFFEGVSEKIAVMAKELGCHGIIAPGNRPEKVAKLKRIVGDLKVLCPGIGAQGGDAKAVVEAGADAIIVGRAIYEAEDPKEVARMLSEL